MSEEPVSAPVGDFVAERRSTGLGHSVTAGVGWSGGGQLATQVVVLVRAAILARLLTPEDFGTFGLLALAFALAAVLSDSGLGTALVQRQRLEPRHLHTAFWMQGAQATLSGVALAASGPLMARFFGKPELTGYCLALGAAVALSTWGSVHAALLSRELRFRTVAIRELAAALAGVAVALLVAMQRRDPWALVLATITTMVVSNLSAVGVVAYRPRMQFDRAAAQELLRFSRNVVGAQVLAVFVRNLDNVLVGRFLGTTALGLYSRGYQVLLFPLSRVSRVVGRVMFPAMSAIQGDAIRARRGYLQAVSGIALVTFPLLAGVAVTAPELVAVLLGPQWTAAVPIIRVFAIAGLIESITTTGGWIYQSQGRTRAMLRMSVLFAIVMISGVSIGVARGSALDVAVMFVVSLGFLAYPALRVPCALIGLRVRDVWRAVAPQAGCTVIMTATVALARAAVVELPPVAVLGIGVAVGGVSYATLIHLLHLDVTRVLAASLRRSRG